MKLAFALGIYLADGFAEIAGCFAFWSWVRLGKTPLGLIPGVASLVLFAFVLTRIESNTAHAACVGAYITASLIWMRLVEGRSSDRWELVWHGHLPDRSCGNPSCAKVHLGVATIEVGL